jgi:hypothetical protein
MSEDVFLDYVKASAALQGLALDTERAQAVAAHLTRTAQLAQLLNDVPLPVDEELVEIYCPARFLLSSNMTK